MIAITGPFRGNRCPLCPEEATISRTEQPGVHLINPTVIYKLTFQTMNADVRPIEQFICHACLQRLDNLLDTTLSSPITFPM